MVGTAIGMQEIGFGTFKPRSQLDDPRSDLLIDLAAPTGGVELSDEVGLRRPRETC
jgi:hypothetical protein